MNINLIASVALATSLIWIAPAAATPLGPSSGFLPSYLGPQNGDFDIVSGNAILRGSNFEFDATFAAAIGTTPSPGVFYVWGIDRGLNIAPFGAFRSGVLFDAVVISDPKLNQNFVVDLTTMAVTPLPASDVFVNGDMLKLIVPTSFLPSEGFAFNQYLVNLWTRDGLNSADNTQIAEFAPSDSDVSVTIPEPITISLFGAGLIGAFTTRRRKRKPD